MRLRLSELFQMRNIFTRRCNDIAVLLSPRKRGNMFSPASVCLSVCLSVDGFAPNFMRRFLGGREDQDRVSLRSVEGCGSNGQKLRKPAIVYKIAPSGNSNLAGRKIVGVSSVVKCWQQKRFGGDLYSLRVLSV